MNPEIRLDPATGRVAIRTALPDPKRAWFVFDPQGSGGHYALGTRAPDDVQDWLLGSFLSE